MQDNPLVSVICLSYNHEKYVVAALESVMNQTYSNIELIIADDCSNDSSKEVIENWLKKHPNITFLPNTINLGNTKTFNSAVKHAKGDYFIDLAADDMLLPNCIEQQIKTFQNSKFTNLGMVYANIELIDENDTFISIYYNENDYPESGDIYKMVISRSTMICSIASMIKKEVFDEIGYYDENLAFEDLDFWIRASRLFDFEYIPEILAKKRELNSSLSSFFKKKFKKKNKELQQSNLKIIKKAHLLNNNRKEDFLLLNRVKFEILRNFHSRNFYILSKFMLLYMKIFFKALHSKHL